MIAAKKPNLINKLNNRHRCTCNFLPPKTNASIGFGIGYLYCIVLYCITGGPGRTGAKGLPGARGVPGGIHTGLLTGNVTLVYNIYYIYNLHYIYIFIYIIIIIIIIVVVVIYSFKKCSI